MADGVLITEAKIGEKRKAGSDSGSTAKSSRTGSSSHTSYSSNDNTCTGGRGQGWGSSFRVRTGWMRH
jgi:hypothetical protein